MQVNKYLQHIIRKNNKTDSIQKCISDLQAKKQDDLKTYLFLVQKRLDLDTSTDATRANDTRACSPGHRDDGAGSPRQNNLHLCCVEQVRMDVDHGPGVQP